LLMFNAMIGAWRQANAPPEGAWIWVVQQV
jgi:hypothetical protein